MSAVPAPAAYPRGGSLGGSHATGWWGMALLILTELQGESVALCASHVLGVKEGLSPTEVRGEYTVQAIEGPVLLPDLQHMFS